MKARAMFLGSSLRIVRNNCHRQLKMAYEALHSLQVRADRTPSLSIEIARKALDVSCSVKPTNIIFKSRLKEYSVHGHA